MNKAKIKQSITLTSISVMVSFAAFVNITRRSNIRTVEVVAILALGMSISALIFNLAQLYIDKKAK